MSGANASAASDVHDHSAEQRSHEPSMEEILASIRRIISDDQMLPLSPRASLPPLPSAAGSRRSSEVRPDLPPGAQSGHTSGKDASGEEILDLADVAGHPEHEHAAAAAQAQPPSHFDHAAGQPEHHAPDDLHETGQQLEPPVAPTLQETARTSEPAALEPARLTNSPPPAGRQDDPVSEHEPLVSPETLSSVSSHFHQLTATMLMQNFPPVEQIARELLRPMIKSWLDDNLPVMVERLVRAEIERVARVGR